MHLYTKDVMAHKDIHTLQCVMNRKKSLYIYFVQSFCIWQVYETQSFNSGYAILFIRDIAQLFHLLKMLTSGMGFDNNGKLLITSNERNKRISDERNKRISITRAGIVLFCYLLLPVFLPFG